VKLPIISQYFNSYEKLLK